MVKTATFVGELKVWIYQYIAVQYINESTDIVNASG